MASPPTTPIPSPSPSHESHRPTGYYYFVTAVIVVAFLLVASNVHVIGCCSPYRIVQAISRCFRSPQTLSPEQESSRRNQQIPARKYRKGDEDQDRQSDQECSVCLSAFVDGEDVRQLPQCRHSFHAPCIDMWLYSHADCPLCRTNISGPSPAPRRSMEVEDGPGPSRRPMESSV